MRLERTGNRPSEHRSLDERETHSYESIWRHVTYDALCFSDIVALDGQIQHPTLKEAVDLTRFKELRTRLMQDAEDLEYSSQDREALTDALTLCTMHQFKLRDKKSYRKTESIPYANHPMEMALRVLEMRQEMKLVIACLLHDLPEDVAYKSITTPKDMQEFIRWKFSEYDPDGDIVRIISAETKTTGEELEQLKDPLVQAYLLNSGIGRLIQDQARDALNATTDGSKSQHELSDTDRKIICAVIFDMCRIMKASFHEEKFDPRVLFVKIMDSWQNLQTDGFWLANLQDKAKGTVGAVAKLIRTRIFINVAELLGYREVASEMTERLIRLQDINDIVLPKFGTATEVDLEEWHRVKTQMKDDIRELQIISNPLQFVDVHCYSRTPWGQEANENTNTGLTPYVYIHRRYRKKGEIYALGKDSGLINRIYLQGKEAITLTGMLQNVMGRPTQEYELLQMQEDGSTQRIGTIRVEDFSKRWSPTTRAAHKKPEPTAAVPERNLFHKDLTTYARAPNMPEFLREHGGEWLEAFPYFLSPRAYRRQGDEDRGFSFAVIIRGKIFLAKNIVDGSVWKICEEQGIKANNARMRSLAAQEEKGPWLPVNNDSEQLTKVLKKQIAEAKTKGVEPPGSAHYFFVVSEAA